MKKFREAMFRVLFPHADIKREGDSMLIDQLFAIREDSCRVAIVKDCEMPCVFDEKGKEKGAIKYRREMGTNIVQEEVDGLR